MLMRALSFGRRTFTLLVGAILVFVAGVYMAYDPKLYIHGATALLPGRHHAAFRDALLRTGRSLRYWLAGQITAMALLGALTMLGLWLLGVPLFFVLGLLTALLCFIPNLGPILSVIPPVILSLGQPDSGPFLAVKVVALYAGIQLVESNFITPLIQKKAVELPPALLIVGQVIAGALIGILGIALAAPFLAATITGVRVLHLGKPELGRGGG